ncbi:hypothetical protein O181_022090 [Austropuccinia psidii MF-1]|uniref:Uncharacterized protein n=1 Tax=Austropuccinia psidii MF-1 TaxID=1389203 RepID=A0A9Q3CFU4_9BASI|nr:hypothetical protein [Austropuccinia psidii MF-1]
MSFENNKYSVDKDPFEWCPRQSKRLKAIDPQTNIQMRNQKLLTQMKRELEHAIKCRCNQSCTLDDISNTLQDLRKRTIIGKYYPYKSRSFKQKKPFHDGNQGKTQRKSGRSDQQAKHFSQLWVTRSLCKKLSKGKSKVYDIEQVPEEESPTEYSE